MRGLVRIIYVRKNKGVAMKKTKIVKLIREYCIDCSGDSLKEVRLCTNTDCKLYLLRMGKDPDKNVLSEKQLQALKSTREKRNK